MKVTLAYPWTDTDGKAHEPDATVEVDDVTGRLLVQDGRARMPDNSTGPSRPRGGRKPAAVKKSTTTTTKQEG